MRGPTGLASREDIAAALAADIERGELAGGGRLPSERALAERFGVGRPLVREALRGLAERGLVVIAPGRGAFARAPQAADAARPLDELLRRQGVTPREVVEARRMVERDAARLAAVRASEQDLRALRHAQATLDGADNLLERARWDVAFHALVARASHNQVVETMFASITGLVFELVLRSLGDPEVARAGLPLHHDLLDALARRDAESAARAMEAHLTLADRLYGADYDRDLDALARRELLHAAGPAASLDRATDLASIQQAVDAAHGAAA